MKKTRERDRNEEPWSRFYEDNEYSKKLLGTVSGAGEIRVMSSMYTNLYYCIKSSVARY